MLGNLINWYIMFSSTHFYILAQKIDIDMSTWQNYNYYYLFLFYPRLVQLNNGKCVALLQGEIIYESNLSFVLPYYICALWYQAVLYQYIIAL